MYNQNPRCFKCDEHGHNERVCWHSQPVICDQCHKLGHKSKHCSSQ